jgi:hypothetical protein
MASAPSSSVENESLAAPYDMRTHEEQAATTNANIPPPIPSQSGSNKNINMPSRSNKE